MASPLPREAAALGKDALELWRDGKTVTATLAATFAGAKAHGLADVANPFDPHAHPELHASFAAGAAGGLACEIPRATVISLPPRPLRLRPGCTFVAHAAGSDA